MRSEESELRGTSQRKRHVLIAVSGRKHLGGRCFVSKNGFQIHAQFSDSHSSSKVVRDALQVESDPRLGNLRTASGKGSPCVGIQTDAARHRSEYKGEQS